MRAILLLIVSLWFLGCESKPDRNGKITLGFTITDTMNALLGVPLVDLEKGETIETIVYDFSGHNMDSYIKLPKTISISNLYYFRFKDEKLVKHGPLTSDKNIP